MRLSSGRFLGIDTSNYTTSAALYDAACGKVYQAKIMLPVKEGCLGLRQSDAVFHHTVQLPQVMHELAEQTDISDISAVGVSEKPRGTEGSYMPCFLCGTGLAESISLVKEIPVYKTTHQIGHILAALYSAGKLDLLEKEKFGAFHVSGGTTDCLLCRCKDGKITEIEEIVSSLDLKGGQLIDRTGLMLGLKFPCGIELEKLADKSTADIKKMNIRPVIKNGNCCLSGFENKFSDMLSRGVPYEDVAAACQYAVMISVRAMADHLEDNFGSLPIIFAGGVMSNRYIADNLAEGREAYFAEPAFSCDNAAGTALFAALEHNTLQE